MTNNFMELQNQNLDEASRIAVEELNRRICNLETEMAELEGEEEYIELAQQEIAELQREINRILNAAIDCDIYNFCLDKFIFIYKF